MAATERNEEMEVAAARSRRMAKARHTEAVNNLEVFRGVEPWLTAWLEQDVEACRESMERLEEAIACERENHERTSN